MPLTVAPTTLSPGPFSHGYRLAAHHRLVDGARTLEHDSVYRYLLARPHPQRVAGLHDLQQHVLFGTVRLDPSRGRCRHPEQLLNRCAGLAARAKLQDLPEQDQRDDDPRRLEVDGDLAGRAPEGGREQPRQERRDDAVAVRDAHAEADEREHVETAVPHRLDGPHVEGPRGPETHGRRQRQLQECAQARREERRHGFSRQHVAHRQAEERHGKRYREPEPAAHVAELGVLPDVRRRRPKLQRHAADRTRARRIAHDLRVHGARVAPRHDPRRSGRGRRGLFRGTSPGPW